MPILLPRRHMLGGLAAASALTARPARSANATIDIIHSTSGADHPFQQLIRAYNALNRGVTVLPRQEGTSYEAITQKAMAGIAAGRPPVLLVTGWKLADFARRTLGARDLAETYGPERFKKLTGAVRPSVMRIVTLGGVTVGLPFSLSTPVLYINMDLWRQAGLDPDHVPDTVEALYPMLRTLQERTGKQGLGSEVNEWPTQAYIQNAGGDVIDAEGRPAMDSDAAILGMTRYLQPRQDGIWRVLSISEMVTAFQSGAIGAMITSSARLGGLKQASAFDLRMFRMPGLAGHPKRMNSGGNFLGLYTANREQQDAAYDFLSWVLTPDAFPIWLQTGYLNLTTHELPVLPGSEPAQAQLADGLTAETIWPGPRGLEALQAHIAWVSKMANGTVSVTDGLRGSRQSVERLIASA